MLSTTSPNTFFNGSETGTTFNDSVLKRTGSSCSDFTRAEFVGYFLIQPIICVIGVILNLINFFVFLRGKQFAGSATYRFMMVLSLFDALTLLMTFPQSFVRCKNYLSICGSQSFKNLRYAIFRWHVYIGLFLTNTSEGGSVWMTVLLSVERYLSIKHHYIIKAHCSPGNVRKIILFIIGVCVLINIPLCFVQVLQPIYTNATEMDKEVFINSSYSLLNNFTSNEAIDLPKVFRGYHARLSSFGSSYYYQIYSWMRIIFFNFLPLIFLSCINAYLIYIVRSSGHFRKHSSQNRSGDKRMKAQRNLTILLVTIIFLFLAGQIPQAFAFVKVYNAISGCKLHNFSCCHFYKMYRMVTSVNCLLTYATNFFIYQTLNKHFRAEIYRLCRTLKINGRQADVASEIVPPENVEMVSKRTQVVNPAEMVNLITVGNGDIDKDVTINSNL